MSHFSKAYNSEGSAALDQVSNVFDQIQSNNKQFKVK